MPGFNSHQRFKGWSQHFLHWSAWPTIIYENSWIQISHGKQSINTTGLIVVYSNNFCQISECEFLRILQQKLYLKEDITVFKIFKTQILKFCENQAKPKTGFSIFWFSVLQQIAIRVWHLSFGRYTNHVYYDQQVIEGKSPVVFLKMLPFFTLSTQMICWSIK